MQTILLVGADETLLNTRAAVLRNTGAEVMCSPPSAALAIQTDRQCDLVMLCHSLPAEQCTSLAEAVRAGWPETRILLLQTQREWRQVDMDAVIDGTSSPEPSRLIDITTELLQRSPPLGAGDVPIRGGIARAGPFAL